MQAIKDFLDTDAGAFCWSFAALILAAAGVVMVGWPELVVPYVFG